MSCATVDAGKRLLAAFQHTVANQEVSSPIVSMRPTNSTGCGPNGRAKLLALRCEYQANAA